MSLIDTLNLSTLEHFLNIASYRQSLVASNLANIDTPGYRTRDIDFRSEMKRAAQEPEDGMEEPIRTSSTGADGEARRQQCEHRPRNDAAGRDATEIPNRHRLDASRISESDDGNQRGKRCMNLFDVMDISGSALLAERQRAEIVTSNLANAETTHTAEGGPYRRMETVFEAHREPQNFAAALASLEICTRVEFAWRAWWQTTLRRYAATNRISRCG